MSTTPPTWHGQLHNLAFSLPGFAAFAAAMFVLVTPTPAAALRGGRRSA
ncbi:hypothetical protein [Planotetraspora mira]|nr:hypothetical protein [Planotetraspora mira]